MRFLPETTNGHANNLNHYTLIKYSPTRWIKRINRWAYVLFMQYATWRSKLIPVAWNALQRLRLGDHAVDCPLKRKTLATGDGILESTRWQPVVRFAAVTVMIPLGSGFLPFPRIGPAALASCLSPFDL
jgi:hypothetical protein